MNTPNTALPSGTLLRGGTYRIERVLGQGGFGITYLAIEPDLERYVAIKEFFPKDFCDRSSDTTSITLGSTGASELVSRLKSKFIKEARNIVKFNHSNVIRGLAAFEENNTAYYVMDYVEGESLRELVRTQGPLPVERAVRYVTEIGRALEYIHSQKVSHLDVKPANIMLRENDDTPVLIDFGLSKQYDSNGGQTSTTPVGFTHGFAPLEQYAGVPEFSPKVDLYALAATLYYLITGNTPLQASTLLDSELTFPANFPAHLMQPIQKAMSVTPAQRQPSVASFLAEITSRDTIPNEIKQPEFSNPTGDTTIAANHPKTVLPGENDNPIGKLQKPKNKLLYIWLVFFVTLTMYDLLMFQYSNSISNTPFYNVLIGIILSCGTIVSVRGFILMRQWSKGNKKAITSLKYTLLSFFGIGIGSYMLWECFFGEDSIFFEYAHDFGLAEYVHDPYLFREWDYIPNSGLYLLSIFITVVSLFFFVVNISKYKKGIVNLSHREKGR